MPSQCYNTYAVSHYLWKQERLNLFMMLLCMIAEWTGVAQWLCSQKLWIFLFDRALT